MSNQVIDRTRFVKMATEQQQHNFAKLDFVLLTGIVSPEQAVHIKGVAGGKAHYDWFLCGAGPVQEEPNHKSQIARAPTPMLRRRSSVSSVGLPLNGTESSRRRRKGDSSVCITTTHPIR